MKKDSIDKKAAKEKHQGRILSGFLFSLPSLLLFSLFCTHSRILQIPHKGGPACQPLWGIYLRFRRKAAGLVAPTVARPVAGSRGGEPICPPARLFRYRKHFWQHCSKRSVAPALRFLPICVYLYATRGKSLPAVGPSSQRLPILFAGFPICMGPSHRLAELRHSGDMGQRLTMDQKNRRGGSSTTGPFILAPVGSAYNGYKKRSWKFISMTASHISAVSTFSPRGGRRPPPARAP